MKLITLHPDPLGDQTRLRDLTYLLEQPSYQDVRPCPGCTMPCPCSASPTCTCLCGPGCPQAPVQMSSDGERYPIEPRIVALVFGFNCLRICPPFWSCEGHQYPDGTIQRVPQVWFYTRSLVYPRLIGDWLVRLRFRQRIANPWHICVSYAEGSLDTGFSIEPDLKMIPCLSLPAFQQDVAVIADALVPELRALAREYLDKYRS